MDYAYDLFISYTQMDGEVAASLATRLHDAGLKCFMADRSILAASEWEPALRSAIWSSKKVLLLLTPRSKKSLWVAAEAGAAWILQKEVVPVLMFVEPSELFEPIRKFQARLAETPEQLDSLVNELVATIHRKRRKPSTPPEYPFHEIFNDPHYWERLVKIGQWSLNSESGMIVGVGMYHYLLSNSEYGDRAFRISVRMKFIELKPEGRLNAVNAGIVLGWNASKKKPRYLHLMYTGTRLLLEQVGYSGGDEYYDFHHINEGVNFPITAGRMYEISLSADQNSINVIFNSHKIYSAIPPPGILTGKVGLRPWRSLIECDLFEVKM
jgi:hypothetical protein